MASLPFNLISILVAALALFRQGYEAKPVRESRKLSQFRELMVESYEEEGEKLARRWSDRGLRFMQRLVRDLRRVDLHAASLPASATRGRPAPRGRSAPSGRSPPAVSPLVNTAGVVLMQLNITRTDYCDKILGIDCDQEDHVKRFPKLGLNLHTDMKNMREVYLAALQLSHTVSTFVEQMQAEMSRDPDCSGCDEGVCGTHCSCIIHSKPEPEPELACELTHIITTLHLLLELIPHRVRQSVNEVEELVPPTVFRHWNRFRQIEGPAVLTFARDQAKYIYQSILQLSH